MRTRIIEQKLQPVKAPPEVILAQAQRVAEAIKRLDDCAYVVQDHRQKLGEGLYADIVSQIYVYASFLVDCRQWSISLTDPRISAAYKEMLKFCEFIEMEFGRKD